MINSIGLSILKDSYYLDLQCDRKDKQLESIIKEEIVGEELQLYYAEQTCELIEFLFWTSLEMLEKGINPNYEKEKYMNIFEYLEYVEVNKDQIIVFTNFLFQIIMKKNKHIVNSIYIDTFIY